MRKSILVRALMCCLIVSVGAWALAASEIPKGQMTATAESSLNVFGNSPSLAIDGSSANVFGITGQFTTAWLRIDLGGRYNVQSLGYYQDATWQVVGYSVYVTDSSSPTQSTWGATVADGTLPSAGGRLVPDISLTPTDGHYLIIFVKSDHVFHVNIPEIWIYGDPVIDVSSFGVADATSGSAIYTNQATVNVTSFVASTIAPKTITHYMITEGLTDVPLADDGRWQPIDPLPTSYTILTADPGTGIDVALYAWVKDSAGRIAASRAPASTCAPPIRLFSPAASSPMPSLGSP